MNNDNIINPLVTVVICSYNRAHTITKTIDSVLNQICSFPIEILIGDDGSTDNSKALLLEYQKNYPAIINLKFHEKNLGLGGNWATIAHLARGKYIASCDDDDYWHNPNKLQLQVNFLEDNLDIGLVHTDYRTYDVNSKKINEVIIQNPLYENLTQAIFNGSYQILVSSVMLRTELFQKHVNYEDYIRLRFTIQDWPTWIILSRQTRFQHLDISTVTYSIGSESITTIKVYDKAIKRFENEKKMYLYLCKQYPTDLPYDEKSYDIYVNTVLTNIAYKNLDFFAARKFALKTIELGFKDKKIRFALNPFTFYVFCILSITKKYFQNKTKK
jgi:glycosyltransferase involved in cell wall biosynthesis